MKWKIKCSFSATAILKYSVYWWQMNNNGCVLIFYWLEKQTTHSHRTAKENVWFVKIATKTTQYFRKWKIFIAHLQIKMWHIRIYLVTCVHDVMENMVDRSSVTTSPSQCLSVLNFFPSVNLNVYFLSKWQLWRHSPSYFVEHFILEGYFRGHDYPYKTRFWTCSREKEIFHRSLCSPVNN